MIDRKNIEQLNDYFINLSDRNKIETYFCRIDKYSDELLTFLTRYLEEVNVSGICIERKLINPDENQVQYYEKIAGKDFFFDIEFVKKSVRLWLNELEENQVQNLTEVLFMELLELEKSGKNENIIKNAFVKYMCWFHYRFVKIMRNIGKNNLKILYDGEISSYELSILNILCAVGCDVVLIRYGGEERYKSLDKRSNISTYYDVNYGVEFPTDFSIQEIQDYIEKRKKVEQLYNVDELMKPATNVWLSAEIENDLLKEDSDRGGTNNMFCNAFIRISGVEDKADYCNKLFRLKCDLEKKGKTVFVLNEITPPTPEEVTKIQPGNYENTVQMISDLSRKISCPYNRLKNQAKKAFIDCISEESRIEEGKFGRLKTKAIYLICWFSRYGRHLFTKEKETNYPVFIYFGTCKNTAETMMLRFFASLPVDMLIINPNLNNKCILEDSRLFDRKYLNSMEVSKYPEKIDEINYGTVAYHAEQDLNDILYQDSGMYRNQQFKDAKAITLKTMYEEIFILWQQESNMRPSFEILDNKVIIPTILAKVSGVKNEDAVQYWKDIKKLLVDDTLLIDSVSFYNQPSDDFDTTYAIKNGIVQKTNIIRNKNYPYGIFREEIQEYMLEKIQELIGSKLIRTTIADGIEKYIVKVVMSLDKNITRLIQKMDFTKEIPKIVLVNTGEEEYGLEESIILAYLHLIGFDIILFVPTGYRIAEKFFNSSFFTEHQIGELMYDMKIPNNVQGKRLKEQEQKEGLLRRILNI